ncbi:MAG: phosphate acyltransferase PlsX [Rickettsiales bacterium]|nr:phosphate acyltransferase PlsX [Rickettsiales bacterium]
MRLVLDVMGSDNKPIEAINAARNFIKIHNDVEIILIGKENEIKQYLNSSDKFEIINADNVIHTEDSIHSMLRNIESSMYKALEMVKNGLANGMVTAGTTAAYTALSYFIIKPIKGINKGAFMSFIPTTGLNEFVFLDVGANLNCSGEDLYQFAKMGNIYCKEISHINNPRINVLNIGTEDTKGFEFHHVANKLLKEDKTLNYQGFIESRYLLQGVSDVVVCDGYTGNITLKSMEGSLVSINKLMKKEFKKPWNILGAILSLGVIKVIRKKFDYKRNAGAFVIGLNKTVVKCHGSADTQE